MNAPNDTPRFVILAAIDGSAASDHVIASAARFSRMIAGAELHVAHAIDRMADATLVPVGTPVAETVARRRSVLDAAATRAGELGAPRVSIHLVDGEPVRAILQTAADLEADLILVGTHGRKGVSRLVMGSVAETVVRKAACPVLVVRDKAYSLSPEIEPPCPDCLQAQRASNGATFWCARHAQHHPHAHLHYEVSEGFGAGSMLVR